MILMTIIKKYIILCMDNILLYIKKQVSNKINLYNSLNHKFLLTSIRPYNCHYILPWPSNLYLFIWIICLLNTILMNNSNHSFIISYLSI